MELWPLPGPSVLFSEWVSPIERLAFWDPHQTVFTLLTPVKMQSLGVHEVYVVSMNAQFQSLLPLQYSFLSSISKYLSLILI